MSTIRSYEIDLIKAIAMIAVIGLHTTRPYIIPGTFHFADLLYETCVVAIPLFFMSSGYCLLGREGVNYKYSIIKILGILRYVFIICFSYWLFSSLMHGFDLNTLFVLLKGSFVQKGIFSVFWYFGAMILIYLLYPIINQLFKDCRSFIFFVVFLVAISNIVFIINVLWGVFEMSILQMFRIWSHLLYFCLGGVIKMFSKTRVSIYAVLAFASINVFFQEIMNRYITCEFCEYYYSSIIISLFSIILFMYLMKFHRPHAWFSNISHYFLPVYTIHMFIVYRTPDFDCFGEFAPLLRWIIVLFISLFISYVLIRIPILNKVFKI